MIKTIEEILRRDKNSIKNVLLALKFNKDLSVLKGKIMNYKGALSQHLCGYLTLFNRFAMDKTGFIRNRYLKFSEEVLKRDELI